MHSFIDENFFPDVDTIYQYCSTHTFMEMVKNRELWLTNISKMNDFAEEKWAYRLLSEVYKELRESDETPHTEPELFSNLYEDLRTLYPKFACCFSESPDILSQWRAYADDAKGFSVGFATKHLDVCKEPPKLSHPSDLVTLHLIKVLYSRDKQCEFIKLCIQEADAKLAPGEYSGVDTLVNLAVAIKNPVFSEEKEWRIVLPNNKLIIDYTHQEDPNSETTSHSIRKSKSKTKTHNLRGHPSSELFFRDTSRGLASHFIHKFKPEALVEVKLGPKNDSYIEDVELFLEKYGFQNVNVSPSNATYR